MTAPTTREPSSSRRPRFLNVEEQFSDYGAYHTHKVNIAIHLCCVPLIFWTACMLINVACPKTLTEVPWQLGQFEGDVKVTPGFLLAAGYAIYFVMLEPAAGLLYAPILFGMGYTSSTLLSFPGAARTAGLVHGACWIAQFIGHGAFEGRAPALLDNLLQSLVLAVFFVWLEVLFALGYRPELHKRVQNRVGTKVAEFRRQKAAKSKAAKVS